MRGEFPVEEFTELYGGILRRILFYNKIISCKRISKIHFESNRFHYPIYNINIWNFCKNKKPWLFLNERGNGKSSAFISATRCTRR